MATCAAYRRRVARPAWPCRLLHEKLAPPPLYSEEEPCCLTSTAPSLSISHPVEDDKQNTIAPELKTTSQRQDDTKETIDKKRPNHPASSARPKSPLSSSIFTICIHFCHFNRIPPAQVAVQLPLRTPSGCCLTSSLFIPLRLPPFVAAFLAAARSRCPPPSRKRTSVFYLPFPLPLHRFPPTVYRLLSPAFSSSASTSLYSFLFSYFPTLFFSSLSFLFTHFYLYFISSPFASSPPPPCSRSLPSTTTCLC